MTKRIARFRVRGVTDKRENVMRFRSSRPGALGRPESAGELPLEVAAEAAAQAQGEAELRREDRATNIWARFVRSGRERSRRGSR